MLGKIVKTLLAVIGLVVVAAIATLLGTDEFR